MTVLAATAEQRAAFEQSRATALDSAACLLAAFRLLGVPDKMLDVGCGSGHLVAIGDALEVTGFGVDIVANGCSWPGGSVVNWANLTEEHDYWYSGERYDLVLCLEVAEHLPPESADTLCDTLVQATGGTLLFSAATPGQGGSGHLHEMPHEYWREKLEACGLRFDPETTAMLRRTWSEAAPTAWWYGKNIQVFRQIDREGRG